MRRGRKTSAERVVLKPRQIEVQTAQTRDGRSLRIPTLIAEHSRACSALKEARRIDGPGLIEALADAMGLHGIPEPIRCDLARR